MACQGNDFLLQHEGRYYYFAHDLAWQGDAHVVTSGGGNGLRAFAGISKKIRTARWLDNNEKARFSQSEDGLTALECTGYKYGTDMVARVVELSQWLLE